MSSEKVSFLEGFRSFVKYELVKDEWITIWGFSSVQLDYTSIFEPILVCLVYNSPAVGFDIWYCDASSFDFVIKDCFVYLGSLCFHINFWISFYICDVCPWYFH